MILDVMFAGSVMYPNLRQCSFVPQFNAQSHSLNDDALRSTLRRFVREKIIEPTGHRFRGHRIIAMTQHGGSLWSAERCPIWERYCTDRYPAVIRDRTVMSVTAVSPEIRDDFLRLWPEEPARRKRTTIRDIGLIQWHPFDTLHVGLATYHEPDEYELWHKRVENERTWWRTAGELQKFVNP